VSLWKIFGHLSRDLNVKHNNVELADIQIIFFKNKSHTSLKRKKTLHNNNNNNTNKNKTTHTINKTYIGYAE